LKQELDELKQWVIPPIEKIRLPFLIRQDTGFLRAEKIR
jgi:hypothetical protein